jgi:hypothetical protein
MLSIFATIAGRAVEIVDVNFDGASTVGFDYLGIPYSVTAGPAALLNSGVITLQAGGVTRRVNVEPVTGYITVSN